MLCEIASVQQLSAVWHLSHGPLCQGKVSLMHSDCPACTTLHAPSQPRLKTPKMEGDVMTCRHDEVTSVSIPCHGGNLVLKYNYSHKSLRPQRPVLVYSYLCQ